MLKYCDVLLSPANMYNKTGLKEHYKDRVLQEVLTDDEVLKHLRNSELHQLANLRPYYLSFLFPFGIHDIKGDDISSFLGRASYQMFIDIFKHLLKVSSE